MNRKGLIQYISENYTNENGHNITKKDAAIYIDIVTDAIKKASASTEDGKLDIVDFGSFKIKDIPSRQVFSPFHNKVIMTEPKKKVFFTPYTAYMELLN